MIHSTRLVQWNVPSQVFAGGSHLGDIYCVNIYSIEKIQ